MGQALCYGAGVPAFPSHRPLDSIRSAMDRKTESGRTLATEESVTFPQALRHHTLAAAYAAFDEQELGSLEPGKLADFVIWNRALDGISSGSQAASLEVVKTYVGGKQVYPA